MKKKIGLIVLAIAVVAAIAGGIWFFASNKTGTPREEFWKSLAKTADMLGNNEEKIDLKDLAYSQNGKFKMKINIKDEEMKKEEELNKVIDGFSKGEILYNIASKDNKQKSNFVIKYDDKELLKFDLLSNSNEFGIKVDELYNKYFSIENNNLKSLAKRFNIDDENIPDKINSVDYNELVKVDERDVNHIKDLLVKVFNENVPEEAYSVKRNVETNKIYDEHLKATEHKLELTAEQTNNLAIKLLEAVKNDEVTINLIQNKAEMVADIARMFEKIPAITKENVVSAIDDLIKEIKEKPAEEGLKIVIYKTSNFSKIIVGTEKQDIYLIQLDKKGNEIKMLIKMQVEELKYEATIDLKEKNKDESHVDIYVNMDSEEMNIEEFMSYDLKLNDNSISIEDFTDDNRIKINDKSTEDLQKILQEVSVNLIMALPKKAQILGIDISSLLGNQ